MKTATFNLMVGELRDEIEVLRAENEDLRERLDARAPVNYLPPSRAPQTLEQMYQAHAFRDQAEQQWMDGTAHTTH